ncbi:MAG: hypothetical protein JKY18_07480 [Flavobacteriales bacterium]|nr:hypothetical protein [Flavobacteriales bacterium]
MIRVFIATIIMCGVVSGLSAQDLIVTNNGDSLECQITKVEGDLIYITFIENSVEKKAVMPRSMIGYYAVDYKDKWEEPTPEVEKEPSYPRFRASIGGGLANLIGKTPENITKEVVAYVEELKTGGHFSAAISFYISENTGLGIMYSMFKTQNQLDDVYVVDSTGNVAFGLLEDDITIQFVGPAMAIRKELPRGNAQVIVNIGYGIISYRNEATVIDGYTITGQNIGFSGDLGLDFEIGGNLYLGIKFGMTMGTLKEFSVSSKNRVETVDLTGLEYSNVSRFDLGIGLRFYK